MREVLCRAGDEVVHRFRFDKGYLSQHVELKVGERKTDKLVPTGVTTSGDGSSLYVGCGWGGQLAIVPTAGGKVEFGEDFHTCLHRELREELGIQIEILEEIEEELAADIEAGIDTVE